jgi:hypothetical protein
MRIRTHAKNVVFAIGAAVLLVALMPQQSSANSVIGSAGTDTRIPDTDSAVTVSGSGPFSTMQVKVNQTRQLVNQAVSISWTGATPTLQGPGRFGGNFLQIFQCWGEDDGSNQANPGPPPSQCATGAASGVYGGLPSGVLPGGFSASRLISRTTWPNFSPQDGYVDSQTSNVWMPFKAVDGTEIGRHIDPSFNPSIVGGNFWLNPFFSASTTNEIAAGQTLADGTGSEIFQTVTGLENSGLGCGQRVEPQQNGSLKVPKCWIVVVPRSTAQIENVGTPYEQDARSFGVFTSPLSPSAWSNRIAIPLEFVAVDSQCSISQNERRIVGNELLVAAITKWQPKLCSGGSLPPFVYATVPDAGARQQIVDPVEGSAGLSVVQRPLESGEEDPLKPTVYAPLSISGLAIAFNFERIPKLDAPQDEQTLAGVRVANINLTPRTVAKLLTQSYVAQVQIYENPGYAWQTGNPNNLATDPDFLNFNPEFALLQVGDQRTFSGLQLPSRNSDAARQIWEWILADPEAKRWLDGQPDEWGMKVNPVYATTASANSSGLPFADSTPESLPKADPFCHQSPAIDTGVIPNTLCGPDWMPYSQSLTDVARVLRVADDGARIVKDVFALSTDQVWKRAQPQYLGRRAMIGVTDTPSALIYGLQVARLSRAGDNAASRQFISPTSEALVKAVASMTTPTNPAVREPDQTKMSEGSYPLSAINYGVIRPLGLPQAERNDYASFIDYAAGAGQSQGYDIGQLPIGYAPMPQTLRQQASDAAKLIREMQPTPVASVDGNAAFVEESAGAQDSESFSSAASIEIAAAAPITASETGTTPTPEQSEIFTTPIFAMSPVRFVIPALVAVGVFAALSALEITKRPRRRRS